MRVCIDICKGKIANVAGKRRIDCCGEASGECARDPAADASDCIRLRIEIAYTGEYCAESTRLVPFVCRMGIAMSRQARRRTEGFVHLRQYPDTWSAQRWIYLIQKNG